MINFFVTNFSAHMDLAIFLIAMIPTLECRVAIPFGFAFSNLSPFRIYLLSFLGSIVPCIPIIFIIKRIKKRLSNKKFYQNLQDKYKTKIEQLNSRSSLLKKLVYLSLFVAIPLPLTGVWSGSLIAGIVDLPLYYSFVAISIGSMIATALMLLCSLLFGGSVIYLLLASIIIVFLVLLITIIKKIKRK